MKQPKIEATIGQWADYLDIGWDVGFGFLDTGHPDSDYDYSYDPVMGANFRSRRIPKENTNELEQN